jgi:hypothetical protein
MCISRNRPTSIRFGNRHIQLHRILDRPSCDDAPTQSACRRPGSASPRFGAMVHDIGGTVTLTDLRLGAITVHFEAEGEKVKTLGVPDDWQLLTPAF